MHHVRWPTIRYFNKDTGPEGASYAKRTSDAICVELGDKDYLADYVEQSGSTALCSVSGENCDEREQEYLKKIKQDAQIQKEADRLGSMDFASMSVDDQLWAFKQRRIVQRLLLAQGKGAKEEL